MDCDKDQIKLFIGKTSLNIVILLKDTDGKQILMLLNVKKNHHAPVNYAKPFAVTFL